MGDRFRLVANEIDVVEPDEPLPRLPVACAVWKPKPDLRTATESWLAAGAPHHTVLSTAIGIDAVWDFAEMARTELVVIDASTTSRSPGCAGARPTTTSPDASDRTARRPRGAVPGSPTAALQADHHLADASDRTARRPRGRHEHVRTGPGPQVRLRPGDGRHRTLRALGARLPTRRPSSSSCPSGPGPHMVSRRATPRRGVFRMACACGEFGTPTESGRRDSGTPAD